MLTTSFRSLRAITGMAKHGAYRRTQHSWQILLRSYVSTTRRTAASLLWGHYPPRWFFMPIIIGFYAIRFRKLAVLYDRF